LGFALEKANSPGWQLHDFSMMTSYVCNIYFSKPYGMPDISLKTEIQDKKKKNKIKNLMGFDTHLATLHLAYSMSAYCMWDVH